ncbi:MAG: orotate phosphoribosyltransferase [Acidobacteria bacterium]|nr:MAG: orotate phosphoribosyltransferase [Acidobacteriota bacterium]
MQANAKRERLAQLLRELSLRRGRFRLASGRESDYYLDCRRTTLSAEGATLVGELVLAALDRRGWRPAAVGGLTLGADPVAVATAVVSQISGRPVAAFIVRKKPKDHGTGRRIEGCPPPGSRVVLVEDVVTTGGSALEAAGACREAGLEILGAVAIVDREEGGREAIEAAGIPLEALFTASELLAG